MRTCFAVVAAAAFLGLVVPASAAPGETIPVGKKARIVLMGNGLGSRMVHFAPFETGLHLRYPDHELFIRNMCDEGNTPGFRPHSGRKYQLGFPGAEKFVGPYCDDNTADGIGHFETEEEWLAKLKPDVIIAFFGFNESFQGRGNLENFRGELDAFVKHTLGQKYNGKAPPKLALVSPTAFQDITDVMGVPDGKRENANLAAYTAVMEGVALQNDIPFVNAFRASKRWYREGKRLTSDGALLNGAGYGKLATLLIDTLFGKSAPKAAVSAAKVREAVIEKNWFWINDFKIPNGVHVFGRRYNPYGPANYPFELKKIREMAAIRDRAIWATLRGETLDVAKLDAATSTLPPVKTNYKASAKNGQLTFLEGKAALDTIKVPEGFRIQQWATEKEFPHLANPVQLSFDNKGRLWVAVMPSYPHYRPGDPRPNDKLLILEDTDGDGKADKETVFADKLHLPMGFEITAEGVYLSQGINLVLLRDLDGDDHADTKEIIFSGFDDHDTHHAISAYCADPSGAIIMCEGVFLRTNVETPYGPVRATNGGFYRYAPQRRHLERHAQLPIPNPWGVAFDDWGQHFFLYTSGPTTEWMLPGSVKSRYGVSNPKSIDLIEPKHRVRPTSGLEFVSSRHFPDEMQGDMLLNNNIGFRGTKQHKVVEDSTGYRTQWRQDLTVSSDGNYRPVDLEFAPDGSLYIVDWHNPLIGHMQHNARDPNRDHDHGRIYRITYPSRPLVKPAQVAGAPIPVLLDNLTLPEYRTRYRTRRELRGRNPGEVLAALKTWMAGLDRSDARYEHHLLEGLWVSWGLNRVDQDLLGRLLGSKDHRVRAAAVRVLRYTGHQVADQVDLLKKAARDPHGRVKLEAIVAASWLRKQDGLAVLAEASAGAGAKPVDEAKGTNVRVLDGGREVRLSHPALAKAGVTSFQITVPGAKRTINLAEMVVTGDGGRNITGEISLKQSSEYGNGQYPVKNLVDGRKDNFSHTAVQRNPWIKATLRQPRPIDEVRIWTRQKFESRFDRAKIEFFEGRKKIVTLEVRVEGGGGGGSGPFADDPWIRDVYRTAEAHLNGQTLKDVNVVKVPGHLKGAVRKRYLEGAEIYSREGHCVTCHQADGEGLELSGFPPISKSPWVTEDPERLVKVVLNGMMGPIEVKGKTYPGLVPMTPFGGMLSDEEIAAVLTYVRNSFGNQASPVEPATVRKVREATKAKVGFYSPAEILDPSAAPATVGRAFVKMWTFDDLKGDFARPLSGRDFDRGARMFETAGCIKCHNVGGKGGHVGADLSKVGEEYPGPELVRQIVEPSARIRDEHRVFAVTLKDGGRFKGMIVKREGDTLQLAENLQEPDKTRTIRKADIARMTPSDVSPMPTGLLVTLKREEILDLVAYIVSKGDRKHRVFGR